MINVGIIGCGHWGPNHIRIFSSIKGCRVKYACDINADRLEYVKEHYPNIITTTDFERILKDEEVGVVVVATPTSTHYELTKLSLQYNKDVLCEKPLTVRVEESEELVKLAQERQRILMVGHVFIFNVGIQKLKEYLQNGDIGKVYYMHAIRTNLGPIRQDVNAVLDLASHDVSIFNYLLDSEPYEVTAKGGCYLQDGIEDVAFITLKYPKRILASIHVSWLDPKKVRWITVVGDKKMITWDDLSMEPIRIYNKGVIKENYYDDYGQFHLLLRDDEILIPKVELKEPLRMQGSHFIECVRSRSIPLSNGMEGLKVVSALKKIQMCLKDGHS